MADFNYFDFSGGIDRYNSKPMVNQTTKKCYWADAKNIEFLDNKGLARMNGSTLLKDMASKILGLKEIVVNGNKELLVNTADGKLNRLDNAGNLTEVLTGFSTSEKCNYSDFINDYSVIITDGVNDPIYYYYSGGDNTDTCDATTATPYNIRTKNIATHKGRVFLGDGATLYYSALGKFDDWTTSSDAGSISNFQSDNSPITCLGTFKDYLVIHKGENAYLLSGSAPDDFVIVPFADKGALSPFGVKTIDNNHYFFNNGLYPFSQVGELNQIRLQNNIDRIIEKEISGYNANVVNEYQLLHYRNKKQMWFFLAKGTSEYFNTIYIYDYLNQAWFKRVVPYDINYACEFNNGIVTGDKDGKIYQEDLGNTFNGTAIEFEWYSPYYHFGNPNKKKTIEEFYLIFDSGADNVFTLKTRKDYNDYEIDEESEIELLNGDDMLWASDDETVGGDWADDAETVGGEWSSEGTIEYERDNISGSNRSVQLIIQGDTSTDSVNLLGFEFRDVVLDE